MRIKVNGSELFVDIDGAQWVPDGSDMRRRPTLVLLHGGAGVTLLLCSVIAIEVSLLSNSVLNHFWT